MSERADVVVIGAGPAGLTAATRIRHETGANVVVMERESVPGGIPRHSDHTGYGLRDRRRLMRGPAYAARLTDTATDAGVDIRTRATVTHWSAEGELECTSPSGRFTIGATATLLATGARERPRAARLLAGSRPSGILTTGELQQKVHIHGQSVGERAVVLGGELVSWSAVMTLREAGCRTVGLVSAHRRPEAYGAVNLFGPPLFRAPIHRESRVTRILGRGRVDGVEIMCMRTGKRTVLECDTVVTTADWIPDHEIARQAGLQIDPGSKAPVVDPCGRTNLPGVFAAGNCVHPVDTADVAALGGRHVAQTIARFLDRPTTASPAAVPVQTSAPLRWVSPGWWIPGSAPARGRISAWTDTFIRFPTVTITQAGTTLARSRLAWPAAPGRIFRIPSRMLAETRLGSEPVRIHVE